MRPIQLSCVVAVLSLAACGGSDSPTVTPTPTPPPVVNPTPTPPTALNCPAPTPPPLRYVSIKIHNNLGYRKVLDTKPQVENVDGYCGKVGFPPTSKFCDTRPEGSLEREGCDYMAMGRSAETGRYGPTWFYEGKPCAAGPDVSGCTNHESNQFMVYAKGPGEYAACAASNVPVSEEGTRCGVCVIKGDFTTECNK